MNNNKKIVLALIVVSSIIFVFIAINFNRSNTNAEYTLGRAPQSFQTTINDNVVFFKDDVLYDDSYFFQGLYMKEWTDTREDSQGELLYDEFDSCPNYYNGNIYFIDTNQNIIRVDIKTKKSETIIDEKDSPIGNLLIIDNAMYYLQSDDNGISALFSYDLLNNSSIKVIDNTDWYFLYNYRNNIGVTLKDTKELAIWNLETEVIKYEPFEYEVEGILDNGNVICYNFEDDGIYMCENMESRNYKRIFQLDNIYNLIIRDNKIVLSTIDQYEMIEVYMYYIESKSLVKIANANAVPRDFNDEFIICCSDTGFGDIDLIDIKTSEIRTFSRH